MTRVIRFSRTPLMTLQHLADWLDYCSRWNCARIVI
jgi:hypothetical protein